MEFQNKGQCNLARFISKVTNVRKVRDFLEKKEKKHFVGNCHEKKLFEGKSKQKCAGKLFPALVDAMINC